MENEFLTPLKIARLTGTILLFLLIFSFSLWLGRGIGTTTRRSVLAAISSSSRHSSSVALELKQAKHNLSQTKVAAQRARDTRQEASGRQRNILLIGVDSLQSEAPRLEGVWMVLYLRDTPHFMLLPVYPSQTQNQDNPALIDQNLARLFSLEDEQTPNPLFLQALKDKQLWWDGFIVLDKSALVEILALTSSGNATTSPSQQQAATNLTNVEEAPMRSLLGQAQLAQELCRSSGAMLASDKSRPPRLAGTGFSPSPH